jgi:peptidase M23-like protein
MSWQDIMRRVLPPIGGVLPHNTSPYGATDRPPNSTNPHEGIDFNYKVPGQRGINLEHPALRSPVTGIVTNAGEGTAGRIAIRDSSGLTHEILHSHKQYVRVGDPVAAGQFIGTMGNTGVNRKEPEKGPHHVHYQLRTRAGKIIDPGAFWDQQGPIDPSPAPPAFLGEHQQYLRSLEANPPASASWPVAPGAMSLPNPAPMGDNASAPFGTGGQFVPGSATSSRPLYETRSFVASPEEAISADTRKDIRRLVRMPIRKEDLAGFDPNAPAAVPNEIPSPERPTSFDDRFGSWTSFSGVTVPLAPNQPIAPPPQPGRPPGLVTGRPMPAYPFLPPSFGSLDMPSKPGAEDWAWALVRRAEWDKKTR